MSRLRCSLTRTQEIPKEYLILLSSYKALCNTVAFCILFWWSWQISLGHSPLKDTLYLSLEAAANLSYVADNFRKGFQNWEANWKPLCVYISVGTLCNFTRCCWTELPIPTAVIDYCKAMMQLRSSLVNHRESGVLSTPGHWKVHNKVERYSLHFCEGVLWDSNSNMAKVWSDVSVWWIGQDSIYSLPIKIHTDCM